MRRLVVGLAAVALLAGACGQADTAKTASGGAVTIGAVYPTSGGQGPGGRDEYEGAKMAIDLANQAGGVRGRKLELRLIDTPGPDAAPAAVERLHEKGVQLVLGSYGSVISEPAAAAASNRSMLFWETGAVGEQSDAAAGGERFFRMPPTGANLGRSGIAFARDVLTPRLGAAPHPGPLRYTVAYVDDLYGAVVETPGRLLSAWSAYVFDLKIVDGAVNGVGNLVRGGGERLRPVQSGFVRNYALGVAAGAVAIFAFMIFRTAR